MISGPYILCVVVVLAKFFLFTSKQTNKQTKKYTAIDDNGSSSTNCWAQIQSYLVVMFLMNVSFIVIQVRAYDLLFFDSIVVHTVNEHMVLTHWNFLNISNFVVFALFFSFPFRFCLTWFHTTKTNLYKSWSSHCWFVNERNFCSVRRFIYFIHWFVCELLHLKTNTQLEPLCGFWPVSILYAKTIRRKIISSILQKILTLSSNIISFLS